MADRTGTGGYGRSTPPSAPPLVVALMSGKPARDAEHDEALLAEATRYVATLT